MCVCVGGGGVGGGGRGEGEGEWEERRKRRADGGLKYNVHVYGTHIHSYWLALHVQVVVMGYTCTSMYTCKQCIHVDV